MTFNLPANAVSDIASSSSSFISGISSYVTLLLGIFLAFVIIEAIVFVIKNRND